MPATLTKNDDTLELDLSKCRGSEFQDVLTKIKEVPGRKYDPDRKLWLVPAEPLVAERVLHSIEPNADAELREWVRLARSRAADELTTPLPADANLNVDWARQRAAHQPHSIRVGDEELPFNGLMVHQRPVVELAATKRKLLIADDMGLGKTGTSISAVEEWRLRNPNLDGTLRVGPRLVVCPNSAKGTWERELKLWLGQDVPYRIIDGATPAKRHEQIADIVSDDGWAIVNWEQVRVKQEERKRRNGSKFKVWVMKEPLFEETNWLAVIGDEVHRAKNRKAQQARGLWRCRADDGVMLGLSGTPLMNSPDELWSILRWLWPDEYHERGDAHKPGARAYWAFYTEYVDFYEGHFGKVITGVKNPDALRFELRDRVVRRTQGQVLDLPGKGRIRVSITLNPKQRKLYKEAETQLWLNIEQAIEEGDESAVKFAQAAAEGKPASTLLKMPNGAARTVRLRQIIETPATLGGPDDSAVLDSCVDHVMDSRPEQWVVFCEFVPTTEILVERLRNQGLKAEAYNGKVDPARRAELEDEFQKGNIDVLVGTIETMYQSITLTAGSRQFWVSRDWTPDKNEQGEDRQNRIGQTKRVQVFIAQPEDTVATDKVEPTNRLKERIVRTVLPKDHIEERKA